LPPDELTYPNALALSPGVAPGFLFVANTNFDLRYNAASVHSYNLASIDRELAARRCRIAAGWPVSDGGTRQVVDNTRYTSALDASIALDAGPDLSESGSPVDAGAPAEAGSADDFDAGTTPSTDAGSGLIDLPDDFATSELGNPQGTVCDNVDDPAAGDCCFDTPAERDLIREDSVPIDSYAVGLGISPDGKRVYVPISSKNQLTYLDVDNGKLGCAGATGLCRRGPHLHGVDDVPDDTFPGTLSTISVGKLTDIIADGMTPPIDASTATFIVATHELGGYSLFIDRTGTSDPVLESVGHNLPERPRAIVPDPQRRLLYVASADATAPVNAIARLGVRIDPDDDVRGTDVREPGPRELLYQTTAIVVSGVSQPTDVRDLALDPRYPNRLYALVRGAQESIVFLELDPTVQGTGARLIDAVRVGAGPSKVEFIQIDDRPFLMVSCYDAKAIYIIDPDSRTLVSVVRSLSGPFEMAFDASRKLLHVTDFRASVLRIIDLEGLVDRTKPPPRIVATIGKPRFKGVK
jgi:DNA-binding beta-propeller fold protein YncE